MSFSKAVVNSASVPLVNSTTSGAGAAVNTTITCVAAKSPNRVYLDHVIVSLSTNVTTAPVLTIASTSKTLTHYMFDRFTVVPVEFAFASQEDVTITLGAPGGTVVAIVSAHYSIEGA